MANEHPYQLVASSQAKKPPIELSYPQIPIRASVGDLLSHSTFGDMADESQSDKQDIALSESWATLSDADYSFDDDLRSETTDAASLVDHTGQDDLHSIDDQTSDAGFQDSHSDENGSEEHPPHNSSVEPTKMPNTESVGSLEGSRLRRSIVLEPLEGQTEDEITEVTQVIHSFSKKDAHDLMGYVEPCQIIGRVCMKISKNSLNLDRPFRLLYIGDVSARAEILNKIGDVLMAGPNRQRNRSQQDSSRYHVVLPSNESDSPPNHADLIPIKTQIIVDDCTTAASIKDEEDSDQIFLSFKNGSLYSSRWNGAAYEISSASTWSNPDLAVFFVTHHDNPVVKQRHRMARAFVMRHQIPALIISENTTWALRSNDLQTDHRTPHLCIEAHGLPGATRPSMTRTLPIDLATFKCLESDQLNENFACLLNWGNDEVSMDASESSSAPSHTTDDKNGPCRRQVGGPSSLGTVTWSSLCVDSPVLGTVAMVMGGLMSLAIGFLVCKVALAMFIYLLTRAGNAPEWSPATAWSLQPSAAPTVLEKTASVSQTTAAALVTSNKSVSRSLATIDIQSDLAELMDTKVLQKTNVSENFEVHSIGDCHIVVRTPRGFKVKNQSNPFDVVVGRGGEILESSLSKLFDGVYTVRVDREQAYGLLNVTIRRHKSSILEEHQIDFGAQWLKVAGWKKALKAASEQVRTDLDTAQIALSTAYDQLSEDMQIKSKDVSKKAARQAKRFSQHTRYFLNSTAKLLKARSKQLRYATKQEREEAYKALSKRADLAFEMLVVYAHTTNERGRSVIEKILLSAGQTAEHIQQNTPHIDLAEVQNRMLVYLRSEKLAMAQERAKQILRDTSAAWRRRRASRKVKGATFRRSGKGRNR